MKSRHDVVRILNRVKTVEQVWKDSDVAEILGAAARTVSNWKHRGQIPQEYLLSYCRRKNLSLEWLINGRGPMHSTYLVSPAPDANASQSSHDDLLDLAATVYQMALTDGASLSPEKFRQLLRHAYDETINQLEPKPVEDKIRNLIRLAM